MKQVIARAGTVVVADVPAPVCEENGLLIQTNYSVISTGTESWTIDSTDPLATTDLIKDSSLAGKALRLSREVIRQEGIGGLIDYADYVRHPEVTLGYSSSGVVIEVGQNVKDVLVGDRVACAGEGKACHAEFVSVPRNLVAKVPEGLPMRDAAFATIGAIAVHAVRTSQLQVGETVGVIGAGLVGNLVAQIARASGCRVVCIDLKESRLTLAAELGVDLTLKPDDPAMVSHISHFTGGIGLDHVLVCAATSSSDPLNMAGRIARNRGRIVVVGRVGMEIERKDFYQKELSLLMSRSLGPGRYDPVYEEKGVDYPVEYVRWTLNRNMESFMELLSSGRVRVGGLVGSEFPLASAPEAYDSLGKQAKTAVLLSYGVQEAPVKTRKPVQPATVATPVTGKINVAVVGPGNFAKETLIPLMRASPEFNLRWVVSSNPTHATRVASRYRFEESTCDYGDVLNDPKTNLVVITAPNNLHVPMLVGAMKAAKTALVEKPLCINRGEFEEIKRRPVHDKLQGQCGVRPGVEVVPGPVGGGWEDHPRVLPLLRPLQLPARPGRAGDSRPFRGDKRLQLRRPRQPLGHSDLPGRLGGDPPLRGDGVQGHGQGADGGLRPGNFNGLGRLQGAPGLWPPARDRHPRQARQRSLDRVRGASEVPPRHRFLHHNLGGGVLSDRADLQSGRSGEKGVPSMSLFQMDRLHSEGPGGPESDA